MRVVEPAQFKGVKKHKRRRSRVWLRLLAVTSILAVIGIGYFKFADLQTERAESQSPQSTAQTTGNTSKKGVIKQFSGEEFKNLYRTVAYPNTQAFVEPPEITGNKQADIVIRKMAEDRGYLMTSFPVAPITKINEPRLEGDDLLQPLAASGWQRLKTAATQEKIPLSVISTYRSPEYQRTLFVQRLLATGTTPERIAAGLDTTKVDATLHMTAVPGFSRHHTGYTVDLWCEDGSGQFLLSSCNKWISANNYQKAKENGWIPSYPADTSDQGPEPEPWEYVWVGIDKLTE